MDKITLLDSLENAHPGWAVWDELIDLVRSLDFRLTEEKYVGVFFSSGTRLTFEVTHHNQVWPDWVPVWVPPLFGLKADEYMMAGGYADNFDGDETEEGSVFASGGTDGEHGFPTIAVPSGVFPFQTNSSGALFHLDKNLNVLYPNIATRSLNILDSLEEFTKTNIQQVLEEQPWFRAYADIDVVLFD